MRKRILAMLMCLVLALSMMPSVAIATETDVTEIATVADLKAFAEQVNAGDDFANKTVKLTANIDLTGETWPSLTSFAGTFDGQNYTISNMTNVAGLFNTVTADGTVKNLKLDNVTADFAANVGYGFLALTMNGKATNCHISNVTVNRAGYSNAKGGTLIKSITGDAVVENCSATNITVIHAANSTNTDCVDGLGGVFGGASGNAVIKNCSGTNVTMTFANKTKRVGGFIEGVSGNAKVENCTLTDFTIGSKEGDGYLQEVGGFAATVSGGTVSDCVVNDATFLTGRVSRQTGGFVGQATGGTFDGCKVIDVTMDLTARGSNTIGSTAGFCGQTNNNGEKTFNNCSVTGLNMKITGGLETGIGGFLTSPGGNGAVNITGCSVEGEIDATDNTNNQAVGGFLGNLGWGGSAQVAIESSEADVDIVASGPVGGFVGKAESTNASATLNVTDSSASGTVVSNSGTANAFAGTGETGTPTEEEYDFTGGFTMPSVAQIGDTTYSSLADAFVAVNAGETIILLDNIDLPNWTSVDVKKAIVLDGNGKTITGLATPLFNNVSTDFEIKNLTISGAEIEVKSAEGRDDNTSAAALVQWANGGVLTLNDVSVLNSTVKGDGYVAGLVGFVDSTAVGVIVNGGTVSGNTLTAGGVVGAVTALTYADVTVKNVTVSQNTLTSTSDGGTRPDKVGLVVGRPVADTVTISATVADDNATSPGNGTVIGSLSGGNAVITGGSYPVDPTVTGKAGGQTASVQEGFEIAKNEDGTYAVTEVAANTLGGRSGIVRYLNSNTGKYEAHFFAGIDSLNYKEVGFIIKTSDGQQATLSTKDVYRQINVLIDGKPTTLSATDFGTEGFDGFRIFHQGVDFPSEEYAKANGFSYQTYAVKLDGTILYGEEISYEVIYQ